MATFLQEEKIINNNAFIYEEKLNSQYTRFLERPPVFVTYYSINAIESMVDEGFLNVERLLGGNSPIRFNKIEHFPVYGLDQVTPNLNEDEEGLTTSYDGDLIILPNTIVPNPNDFFIITHIDQTIVFMVTEVNYDTIKSNSYYKIGFTLDKIDFSDVQKLEKQTVDNFQCIYKNIGTEDKCLVRSEDFVKMGVFEQKFDELIKKYFMLYYDDKTNSLMFNDSYCNLYDKYMTHFIMNNKILQNERDYNTVALTNEDRTKLFSIEYERSIYRSIEKREKNRLPDEVLFMRNHISDGESVFKMLRIRNVMSIAFSTEHKYHGQICTGETYIDPKLIKYIKQNILEDVVDKEPVSYLTIVTKNGDIEREISDTVQTEPINPMYRMIVRYFNNENNGLFDEDIKFIDADMIDYNMQSFVLTPILLFVMHDAYNKFIAK